MPKRTNIEKILIIGSGPIVMLHGFCHSERSEESAFRQGMASAVPKTVEKEGG
ncbi:hypothetical protein MYX77_08805 [Acidobacteriia bacterium AH_259_A11_L15]|nr:hypothetical protein [Acidobacteriia bacterium AH_259_A11_L15]